MNVEVLKNSTNDTIEDFSLNGLYTLCKVVDIYDGDTFRVVFFIKNDDKYPVKMKVRALGYDCAELHPIKTHPTRNEEIRKAKIAKNRLFQLITGFEMNIYDIENPVNITKILNESKKLLYIEFSDFDKYGRVLGTLYLDENKEKSINQILIDENHGVSYYGGSKNNTST